MARKPGKREMSLTVAVPCRDRLASLTDCLISIGISVEYAKTQLSNDRVTIRTIVVNDGSNSGFETAIYRQFPWVDVIESQGVGPGAARNTALQVTGADCYLFTDSDCIVAHHWCARTIEWYWARNCPVAQGVPWLYQGKQNIALGRCEQRLYEHMFSTYINGSTCSMIDPRCLILTSDLLELTGRDVFAAWIPDASAEDRVIVGDLIKTGGAIEWAPHIMVYHEDPIDDAGVWLQKYRHGSGRLHMWPEPPALDFLRHRYFRSPIEAEIDPDYVLPAHLSFLLGYRNARHLAGVGDNNGWWDALTENLSDEFPDATDWLRKIKQTLGPSVVPVTQINSR